MASLQDIRRRIKSVKSIQQITKAMKMVAAARLRRAQQAAVANKPYADKMAEIVENAANHVGDFRHPLLLVHSAEKTLYLVIASDKGLAGAYASNVFKEVTPKITDKDKADLVLIGRKAVEHFGSRGYNIVNKYIGISERPTFEWAKKIAEDIIERYNSGEYSAVCLVYSRFVSAITTVPETVQLLPFEGITPQAKGASDTQKRVKLLLTRLFSPELAEELMTEDALDMDRVKVFLSRFVSEKADWKKLMGKAHGKDGDPEENPDEEEEKTADAAEKSAESAEITEEAGKDIPAEAEEAEAVSSADEETAEEAENLEEMPEELPPDSEYDEEQYIFEPSADNVLGFLLPQYLITMIYGAQLQAAASELSSRMTAMSNATDNAEELIKKLDLHYNKVRQASITREISEIVGGAEALK